MIVDAKRARGSLEATPSSPTADEPVADDDSASRPRVARPAIDPASEPLTPLATRWPHIEADLVRKRALSRRRR